MRLHVSEGFSGDVKEWLVGGRLDVGVLYSPSRTANLVGQLLLVEDLFLCCAPSALDAARPEATLAEAVRLPLILPGRPHGLRILVDSACAETGLEPDVVLELDSMADDQDPREGGTRRDDPALLRRLSRGRGRRYRRPPHRLPLADAHAGRGRDRAAAKDAGDRRGGAVPARGSAAACGAGLMDGAGTERE